MYLSRQIIHHAMINRIHEFLSLSHPLYIAQWAKICKKVQFGEGIMFATKAEINIFLKKFL